MSNTITANSQPQGRSYLMIARRSTDGYVRIGWTNTPARRFIEWRDDCGTEFSMALALPVDDVQEANYLKALLVQSSLVEERQTWGGWLKMYEGERTPNKIMMAIARTVIKQYLQFNRDSYNQHALICFAEQLFGKAQVDWGFDNHLLGDVLVEVDRYARKYGYHTAKSDAVYEKICSRYSFYLTVPVKTREGQTIRVRYDRKEH